MDSKYILGHPTIDSQHEKLLNLIDELHQQVGLHRVSETSIKEVHHFLIEYATEHFGVEADLMTRYSYPEAEVHLAKHNWFIGRIASTFETTETSDALAKAFDTLMALNSWFLNHILKDDAEFVKFLKAKGVDGNI